MKRREMGVDRNKVRCICVKKILAGVGEMVWWLRTLVALAGDPGFDD